MEGSQCQAPGHGDVLQGVGSEAEATAEGRGKEENYGVISGLMETFGGGGIVQVP